MLTMKFAMTIGPTMKLFKLGTPAALELLEPNDRRPNEFLERHAGGNGPPVRPATNSSRGAPIPIRRVTIFTQRFVSVQCNLIFSMNFFNTLYEVGIFDAVRISM